MTKSEKLEQAIRNAGHKAGAAFLKQKPDADLPAIRDAVGTAYMRWSAEPAAKKVIKDALPLLSVPNAFRTGFWSAVS